MVLAGEIEPVIDREIALENTAEALQAIGAGEAIGKIVVMRTAEHKDYPLQRRPPSEPSPSSKRHGTVARA